MEANHFSAEEYEPLLLAKLNEPSENQQNTRLQLMLFYRSSCRASDAMYYAEQYISHASDAEEEATAYFVLGQTMERICDFESALRFYLQGVALEPHEQFYQYFFRNNIAFSLNQLKRYEEAEAYLWEAITIDSSRANAFKNLGLSLEGQGKLAEAVNCFIAAIRTDASDPRALSHLEGLAAEHEQVYGQIPDLGYHIHKCREAVAYVRERNANG